MKLLTFLGTGNYQDTCYVWNEAERVSKYSPVATAAMLNASALTVFLTEDAHEKIYPSFKADLPKHMEIQEIHVSLGKNQTELWAIFNAVRNAVQPGEIIAFDITHGLRSFPLLGLLVAAFLHAGLKMDIKHVLYGAYDVRDQSTSPHRTPIFDLTPMLALLDWANATTRFVKTGDARDLADLLEKNADGNQAVLDAAKAVNDVSLAAFLCQPIPLGLKSNEMVNTLARAQTTIEQQVIPFDLLRERIVTDFGAFQANHHDDLRQALQAQLKLIHWYHKNNQLAQAMTLVREWLINAVAFKLGKGMPLGADEREQEIARAITGLSMLKSKKKFIDGCTKQRREFAENDLNPVARQIKQGWDEKLWQQVVTTWLRAVNDVRNTLDHAGFQKQPASIDLIIKRAGETMPALDQLARDLGIQ